MKPTNQRESELLFNKSDSMKTMKLLGKPR